MNYEPVEEVTEFQYLGAVISEAGGGTKDLSNRINKARATFIRLKKIWNSKSIKRNTKLRLYKTLVKPVLLYGAEAWKMTQADNKKLDTFQSKCLRRILQIKWQDHVSNEDVMKRANVKEISRVVKERRWKFIGHTLRKEQGNDCVTAMTWAPEGKRKRGRPRETWRKTVEKERKNVGWTTWNQVRTIAMDRKKWREQVEALCTKWHKADR